MREQPQDHAERDQADKAIFPEVADHRHHIGDDAAEERDVCSNQQPTNNGQGQEHEAEVRQRAYPVLYRVQRIHVRFSRAKWSGTR